MYVQLPEALWWPCGRRSGRLGTTNFMIRGGVGGERLLILRDLGSRKGNRERVGCLGFTQDEDNRGL